MKEPTTPTTREYLSPPITEAGFIGWLRSNLFNTWYNSLLTIMIMLLLWQLIPQVAHRRMNVAQVTGGAVGTGSDGDAVTGGDHEVKTGKVPGLHRVGKKR